MVGQIYLNFIAFVFVCTKKRFYFCKNLAAPTGTFCAIKYFTELLPQIIYTYLVPFDLL